MTKQRPSSRRGPVTKRRRTTTDGLEILDRRYFRTPAQKRALDEAILNAEIAQEIYALRVKANLTQKQLAKRELLLHVTPAARNRIAALGYDPAYGARPVKRVIQQSIQNPLATELLRGEYPEGATIEVDVDPDTEVFIFRRS